MSKRDQILTFARSQAEPITCIMVREQLGITSAKFALRDMVGEGYLVRVGKITSRWGPVNLYRPTEKQTIGYGKYNHTGKRKQIELRRVTVDEGRTEETAKVYISKTAHRKTLKRPEQLPIIRL